MTEAELQAAVIQAAQLFRWKVHHCRPAMTPDGKWLTRIAGNKGFPDLCLVRPPRVLFVELKSAKGRLSPEQTEWLQDLERAGQEVRIWRPDDWTSGEITRDLGPAATTSVSRSSTGQSPTEPTGAGRR